MPKQIYYAFAVLCAEEEQARVLREQEEAYARGLKQALGHSGLGAGPLV